MIFGHPFTQTRSLLFHYLHGSTHIALYTLEERKFLLLGKHLSWEFSVVQVLSTHRVEHTNGAVTLLEVTFVPETSVTWRLHASLPAAAQSWQCRMSLEISFEQQNLNREFKQRNMFNAEIIFFFFFCNFCWLWNFSFFFAIGLSSWFGLDIVTGKDGNRTQSTGTSVTCTSPFLHIERLCFFCYANTLTHNSWNPYYIHIHCFQTHTHKAPKHKIATCQNQTRLKM